MLSPRILPALALLAPATAHAAAAEGEKVSLLSPHSGLIFWTILIFIVVGLILKKYAWGPLTEMVSAREQALVDAMAAAEQDRNEARKLLAEQKAAIDAARAEAQRFIAEGRATAESMRSEMLEQTRQQQSELLDRARREIENEKIKAVDALRREAVDLALAGAGRLISQKLDSDADRRIVEEYLSSLGGK